MQERYNSLANALELCLSYTNPSNYPPNIYKDMILSNSDGVSYHQDPL